MLPVGGLGAKRNQRVFIGGYRTHDDDVSIHLTIYRRLRPDVKILSGEFGPQHIDAVSRGRGIVMSIVDKRPACF